MKTPTFQELLEYADGSLGQARRVEIERMIADSPGLHNEIALIKKIHRAVQMERVSPSVSFTAAVMNEIVPQRRESLWYRIARNSSHILAMAVVLTMIGFAVVASTGSVSASASPFNDTIESFSSAYRTAAGEFNRIVGTAMQPLGEVSKTFAGKAVLIGCLIFLFYATIDELLGKRFNIRK